MDKEEFKLTKTKHVGMAICFYFEEVPPNFRRHSYSCVLSLSLKI